MGKYAQNRRLDDRKEYAACACWIQQLSKFYDSSYAGTKKGPPKTHPFKVTSGKRAAARLATSARGLPAEGFGAFVDGSRVKPGMTAGRCFGSNLAIFDP